MLFCEVNYNMRVVGSEEGCKKVLEMMKKKNVIENFHIEELTDGFEILGTLTFDGYKDVIKKFKVYGEKFKLNIEFFCECKIDEFFEHYLFKNGFIVSYTKNVFLHYDSKEEMLEGINNYHTYLEEDDFVEVVEDVFEYGNDIFTTYEIGHRKQVFN